MLIKKDRGRPNNPKARPKAYGEVSVAEDVPGAELLQQDVVDSSDGDDMDSDGSMDDDVNSVHDEPLSGGSDDENDALSEGEDLEDEANELSSDDEDDDGSLHEDEADNPATDEDIDDASSMDEDEDMNSGSDDDYEEIDSGKEDDKEADTSPCSLKNGTEKKTSKTTKRKASDFDSQLIAGDTSLRALKKLAGVKLGQAPSNSEDGILSNEDFKLIKELKVSCFSTLLSAEIARCQSFFFAA